RVARTGEPSQPQVPARGEAGQDSELGLHRAEPGVEQGQAPGRHELGQLAPQPTVGVGHPTGAGDGRPHRSPKYMSATAGFGAPVVGASPAAGAGQPMASTPQGQMTTPSGSPSAAANSAARQAVTVAPSPASRAASIAAP